MKGLRNSVTVTETTLSDSYLEHGSLHDYCEYAANVCLADRKAPWLPWVAANMCLAHWRVHDWCEWRLTCVLHTKRLYSCCEWVANMYLAHWRFHDCCEWWLTCVLHTEDSMLTVSGSQRVPYTLKGSMITVSMWLMCVLHTEGSMIAVGGGLQWKWRIFLLF